MSRGFSGGKKKKYKKSRAPDSIQQKTKNVLFKDNDGKLWVEVITVPFFRMQ